MDELKIEFSWVGPVGGRKPRASSGDQWGVWFYDDAWYDLSQEDLNSMRSYKFVLDCHTALAFTASVAYQTDKLDLATYKRYWDTYVEVHFVATLILSSFLKPSGHDFDFERLMGIFAPGVYRQALDRMTRLIFDTAPEPNIIAGVGWYCDGDEFLEYVPKDAPVLGGPIEYQGKEGAYAKVLDVLPDYPEEYSKGPWRVYVAGNDDMSWSLYLPTKEAAETELRYLRQMQPLRHKQDLIWRGYEFTN
jgi:hypothetical protein